MGKSVLGNDPFVRAAARRPKKERKSPAVAQPPAPESAPEAKHAPAELVVVPSPESLPTPASPASTAPADPPSQRAALVRLEDRRKSVTERMLDAATGIAMAVSTGLGIRQSTALDPYGKDGSLEEALGTLAEFLYRRYWRVQVHGAEQLPSGPAILVANHAGAIPLDGPVIRYALLRERPDLPDARWLLEDQVFDAPFWGTLLNRMGAVRASPGNAIQLLNEGRPVIVFPEGILGISKGLSERYRLRRFGRGGFAKLALRLKIPLVPIAIVGSEETLPLLAKLPFRIGSLPYVPLTPLGIVPLPAKWTMHVGAPIWGADLDGSPDDPAVVYPLADRVKATIQEMLDKALAERRSAFRS